MIESARCSSSFRDPSGFLFHRGEGLYRQVNRAYRDHYDRLVGSGLYRDLTDAGLLIAHEEVADEPWEPDIAYRVLEPRLVPFISYPYEWCFSQYRAAALRTLEIQERALAADMSLKDSSAYNIQFLGGRPVLIDTLSFESYREGEPWVAYRQFCEHFLGPLALMSRVDVRLGQLMRSHIDGIPLDLASRLLPWRPSFRQGVFAQIELQVHIRLHAKLQRSAAAETTGPPSHRTFDRRAMRALIDSLRMTVESLHWTPSDTGWADYTRDNTYTEAAREHKRRLVNEFLDRIGPSSVWDLGANTGEYSRLASDRGTNTIAFDLDPSCVERNYQEVVRRGESNLLPLWGDLANPSPSIGWANQERSSLADRGPADAVLALALIHHLAIARNIPLANIADFFHRVGRWLIVEFVPKDDPQVQRLLRSREDIFDAYHQSGFEAAFGERFTIHRSEPIAESGRILYLMQGRGG